MYAKLSIAAFLASALAPAPAAPAPEELEAARLREAIALCDQLAGTERELCLRRAQAKDAAELCAKLAGVEREICLRQVQEHRERALAPAPVVPGHPTEDLGGATSRPGSPR